MLFGLISLVIFFGAISLLYPIYILLLFVIYKVTGGKRNFRSWWAIMKDEL